MPFPYRPRLAVGLYEPKFLQRWLGEADREDAAGTGTPHDM